MNTSELSRMLGTIIKGAKSPREIAVETGLDEDDIKAEIDNMVRERLVVQAEPGKYILVKPVTPGHEKIVPEKKKKVVVRAPIKPVRVIKLSEIFGGRQRQSTKGMPRTGRG